MYEKTYAETLRRIGPTRCDTLCGPKEFSDIST